MKSIRIYILYLLLVLATIGYCWLVYLAKGVFSGVTAGFMLPLISRITLGQYIVWQILAVVSLAANTVLAVMVNSQREDISEHIMGVLRHISWLLLCVFLHAAGWLMPFTIVTPAIK